MVLRNSLRWLLLLALIFTGSGLAAAPAQDPNWNVIIPGIEYRHFYLPDPNNVFVTRMDRNNPSVTLESSLAQGKLIEGKETVSDMFGRYDQALNYWGGGANPRTWGMRNQVIVAINGSYFDRNTGVPQGGMLQSGWYTKRYDHLGGWGGFAWTLERNAYISECLDHLPLNQIVAYPATGNVQYFKDINDPRNENELVLFTPQFNTRTGTIDAGVEVLVEMTRPLMILPEPAFVSGIVRQIFINHGNNLIPFNYIALSASGTEAQTLLDNVQVGSEIQISQEITSYDKDCVTPDPEIDWTKTYASIQGAFFFLDNGQIQDFDDPGATYHNPRTAIAYNGQYIYFIVVDGRDTQHSIGMTIEELAQFTRDTLGADMGVALDGGGSSTMVINGQVVNNTYCNNFSCSSTYSSYLPLEMRNSNVGGYAISGESTMISAPEIYQREVGNGMLMVVALPGEYSSAFAVGDTVTTTTETQIYLGPGTNYAGFATIPMGTQGKILDQMNGLNGVKTKSTYWWYVDFGGVIGWVPQGAITNQGN